MELTQGQGHVSKAIKPAAVSRAMDSRRARQTVGQDAGTDIWEKGV